MDMAKTMSGENAMQAQIFDAATSNDEDLR